MLIRGRIGHPKAFVESVTVSSRTRACGLSNFLRILQPCLCPVTVCIARSVRLYCHSQADGKPVARRGRKASGLKCLGATDSGVAGKEPSALRSCRHPDIATYRFGTDSVTTGFRTCAFVADILLVVAAHAECARELRRRVTANGSAGGNNLPPIIEGTRQPLLSQGLPILSTPQAADPDGDPITFSAEQSCRTGRQFNAKTGA